QQGSQPNRRVLAPPWHCDAAPRNRPQPSSDTFASFRQGNVRLAQVNRFKWWQRKAALRFLRKSGKHTGRWKTTDSSLVLWQRIGSEDRRPTFEICKFRSQLRF